LAGFTIRPHFKNLHLGFPHSRQPSQRMRHVYTMAYNVKRPEKINLIAPSAVIAAELQPS
jgi:hypothetical protein